MLLKPDNTISKQYGTDTIEPYTNGLHLQIENDTKTKLKNSSGEEKNTNQSNTHKNSVQYQENIPKPKFLQDSLYKNSLQLHLNRNEIPLNDQIQKSEDFNLKLNDKTQKNKSGEENLIESIRKANERIRRANNKDFEFTIHEPTKRIMIRVKNAETGETLKEIPPEKTLNVIANIMETAGLLLDEEG